QKLSDLDDIARPGATARHLAHDPRALAIECEDGDRVGPPVGDIEKPAVITDDDARGLGAASGGRRDGCRHLPAAVAGFEGGHGGTQLAADMQPAHAVPREVPWAGTRW